MKNKLTHNLGLKLISLLLAIAIWLIIIYTYDPADTADFTLDVKILNEDSITSLNKVYEVIEGDTVTIRVKGNTSLVNSLKSSDFLATADISKLSPTLHASIDVVCTKSNNVEISFIGKVNMLAIRLEDVAQKQFKITVMPEGTVAEGYYVGNSTTKPNLIQVSGAKSAVERISQIRAVVDVTAATESFSSEAELKAYDENGKEIKTGSLKFSKSPVSVYTMIYGTKEVPIEIIPDGEPYEGYRLTNIEYEPKSVLVAGDQAALEAVDRIEIVVSVANRITSLEETLTLDDRMPENIYLTDPNASVNVRMEIERLFVKPYEIPYENIQLRGTLPEEWTYKLEQTGNFTVKVSGLEADLKDLEAVSLRPYVDLGEVDGAGDHTFTVQFELEERYMVVNAPTILIHVSAIEEEPPAGEGDTTPDGGEPDDGADGSGSGGDTEPPENPADGSGDTDPGDGGRTDGSADGAADGSTADVGKEDGQDGKSGGSGEENTEGTEDGSGRHSDTAASEGTDNPDSAQAGGI